jgi:chromosome segregation ATPase
MFERQNDLMRSSQQFMQAKGAIDSENIVLKKNLENYQKQIEKLKEDLQAKNEQIVELKTKEELVSSMLEKGSMKNDEENRKITEENIILKDQNAKLKQEYDQLDEQYKAATSQHEENKNVLDSLLTAMKSKMNKKERERASLVEINKHLNGLIQKQDLKNIELENRIDSMQRFKQVVKSSKSVQCKGCLKTYQTTLFSAHVKM